MVIIFIFISFIALVSATYCPNACNGHGHCDYEGGVCICYEGWNGGSPDCTYSTCLCLRPLVHFILFGLGECPKGVAWADKAYGIDQAHQLVTCSNAGICNVFNGTCQCFSGFTGEACQRSKSLYLFW